ncbi:hypothetical protein JW978_00640 [Candidatus Dojkabacteria bacterium]|nr:hypothetical protein [Candidatus Dojkabacteria bacterium]
MEEAKKDPAIEKSSAFGKLFTRKNLFIGFVSFCFLLLVTATTLLGYLYMDKRDEVGKLENEKITLENEKTTLESDKASLEEDLLSATTATDAEKQTLQDSITDFETKAAKIDQYNAVLDYVYDLLVAHPTLTGFTQAEYQAGRALAVKTGDQGLITAADNAWNNTDGNPVLRFSLVIKEIVEGIDANT